MRRVGFLTSNSWSASPEETAAWTFLKARKSIRSQRINIQEVQANPKVLRAFDVLWWHFDSSLEIPDTHTNEAVVEALRKFVERGGGILLSLLAAPYVVDLGLETLRPNVIVRSTWSETSWTSDYPDMRGLATFKGHPIFRGFPGGSFTWSPISGDPYSAAYYQNVIPAQGRVVGVEKNYIRVNEDRRIISEFSKGRGRIMTIGAYLYFASAEQRFKNHRDLLTEQSLEYLASPLRLGRSQKSKSSRMHPTYWGFEHSTVEERPAKKSAAPRFRTSIPRASGDLEIHRDLNATERNELFDINGDRILMMGEERGGVEEVWCHPVRILHALKTGFNIDNSGLHWSASLAPEVTIRPESFSRRYTVDEAVIEETVFADTVDPAGVLAYRIKSVKPVEILITAIVDLRMMWPLSPQATGGLRYRWDKGLNAAVVTDDSGGLCSVIGGSQKPIQNCAGQYNGVSVVDGSLVGESTDRTQVAVGMRFLVGPGSRRLALFFGGSSLGEGEAVSAYRRMASDPGRSLTRRVQRFKKLERSTVGVQTPDVAVNDAIRWARWSLDRLFAGMPGVGRSLMAGYGLSSSGWNGGHDISGRPGYAWYFGRDSVWTCLAILDYGDFGRVRDVLEFLGNHQEPTGKILHELTTSGFAHYDAADSTPLYLILMGRYIRASGDRSFVLTQFERIEKALRFCLSTDTDGDHLIENRGVGHGWIEGGHLFPSHSEHYLGSCWVQALEESSFLAKVVGKQILSKRWEQEASRSRTSLEKKFWNPDTGFYRFALRTDGTMSEEKTVLSTVAMYLGCTRPERSQQSLAEFASDRFTTDWGVRIVGKDHPSYKASGYHTGSIWPLFTGWTSLAEFRCHRPLQGYSHLLANMNLYDQFSGGCMEEVLHGERFAPTGVCPHQAWSESMVLQPLFEGLLGLRVDAFSETLHLRPYLPPGWNGLRIARIAVGSSLIDLTIDRAAGETQYSFSRRSARVPGKSQDSVSIVLEPLFPLGTVVSDTDADGKITRQRFTVSDHTKALRLELKLDRTSRVRIRHRLGVGLVIDPPHLRKGQGSAGLRVIEESWNRKTYEVVLEGRKGHEYLTDFYDPSEAIRSIDGGIALAREGGRLLVSIRFPGDSAEETYVRKVVQLQTGTT